MNFLQNKKYFDIKYSIKNLKRTSYNIFPSRIKQCIFVAVVMIFNTGNATAADDWFDRRDLRVNWVYSILRKDEVPKILDSTLKAQKIWAKNPENDVKNFKCVKMKVARASSEAMAEFEKATESSGLEAEAGYVKSASLGYWRAAVRLANSSLEYDYWEGAAPIVAWLLSKNIPAGYNKLADILEGMTGYENGKPDRSSQVVIDSLRWRAAREGDPLAQMEMAKTLEENGNSALVKSLKSCAIEQLPDLDS